jgi:hypothetical protein
MDSEEVLELLVAGLGDKRRDVVLGVEHPPFSAKRRPAKRPPNLADR